MWEILRRLWTLEDMGFKMQRNAPNFSRKVRCGMFAKVLRSWDEAVVYSGGGPATSPPPSALVVLCALPRCGVPCCAGDYGSPIEPLAVSIW